MFDARPPAAGDASAKPDSVLPSPPDSSKLTAEERQVYDYFGSLLLSAELDCSTVAPSLVVAAKTYVQWISANQMCEEKTRYVTSSTGWVTEAAWSRNERELSNRLGQWLAKCCLTIPSLARTRRDAASIPKEGPQDDLFGDLVSHATNSPAQRSTH